MAYRFMQREVCCGCGAKHILYWPEDDCPILGDQFTYKCPKTGAAYKSVVASAWDEVLSQPDEAVSVERVK